MKTIKVAAAIIKKDDKILIAKRNYGQFNGLFEFPGGKLESGENAEDALKREILEELEVHINIQSFFMNVNYTYPDFILDMDCFICTLKDKNIILNNHSEIKWITLGEKNIEWVPADIQIIERLENTYL